MLDWKTCVHNAYYTTQTSSFLCGNVTSSSPKTCSQQGYVNFYIAQRCECKCVSPAREGHPVQVCPPPWDRLHSPNNSDLDKLKKMNKAVKACNKYLWSREIYTCVLILSAELLSALKPHLQQTWHRFEAVFVTLLESEHLCGVCRTNL